MTAFLVIVCICAAVAAAFGVLTVFSECAPFLRAQKSLEERVQTQPEEERPAPRPSKAKAEREEKPDEEKPRKESWWKRHKPTKRRLIQLYAALLTNANLKGFFTGKIYTGNAKYACVPGLNCYSCPAAAGACPLGALQNALANTGASAPYYVFGILLLFGLLLGRTICGFLCPFGLLQELIYKIKTPKLKKSRFTRVFSYLKYVLLAVFVVAIPLIYGLMDPTRGGPVPGFCKYICPAGTFGGAIGLLLNPANEGLFAMLGPLFTWKFCLLVLFFLASVFLFRCFCRFFCPLGAIYGFFNKIALLGVKLDKNKCTDCGLCVAHCKMDIKHVGDHECINCGECMSVCPAKAISWKGSKLFLHKNAVESVPAPAMEERPLGAFLNAEALPSGSSSPAVQAEPQAVGGGESAAAVSAKPKKGGRFWVQAAAWGLSLAVLAGALVYYNAFDRAQAAPETGNAVGDVAPDFTLGGYLGTESFNVYEQRGKILVLNFWTTYCTPCIQEIPFFEQLANEYAEDVTVAIVHGTGVVTDVETFIADKGWADYTALFLQDNEEQNMYFSFGGTTTWPMTVILDREGVIAYLRQGSMTYSLLEEQIKALI